VHDEPGTRVESTRAYFDIPASGAGTEGTNYDETVFGYDDMGRRRRTKDPTGTIRRSTFDAIGRRSATYVGTNDSSFAGGESSGTDDMVKVSEVVYDGGSDGGNGLVTTSTAFVVDGTTDRRDTTFTYDYRNRRIVTANPESPHTVTLYDNLGRTIATGRYSSTSGLTASTDPTTTTANRIALTETDYDARGRVWETTTHKIDQSDGSSDDTLVALTWYDAVGRTIKTDGASLTKTAYDRIGRTTHRFTLAVAETSGGSVETAYADADDVDHDIVLVEQQTTYASATDDRVVMSATIERHHDDYGGSETTGALDTNADGDELLYTAANVEGRIAITAMWHDDLDRVVDVVRYGTNGGSNFDRDGLSVPARSDTALRTTTTFNDDGTVQQTTDPRGLVMRAEYDDLGRT